MEFTIWFKDIRIFLFYSKFHKIQVKLLNSDSMSLYACFLAYILICLSIPMNQMGN